MRLWLYELRLERSKIELLVKLSGMTFSHQSALQSCCFPVAVGLRGSQMFFLCIPQKVEKCKKAFFFFFFLLHAYITGFYSAMFWPWGLILYWDAWQTLAQHILFDIWISRGRAHCNHMPQMFELQYILYCLNSKNGLGFQDLCIKFLFDIKKKPKNPCTYINSNPV